MHSIDVAYCYRENVMVCLSACWSWLSALQQRLIQEMPLAGNSAEPKKHVLDGGPDLKRALLGDMCIPTAHWKVQGCVVMNEDEGLLNYEGNWHWWLLDLLLPLLQLLVQYGTVAATTAVRNDNLEPWSVSCIWRLFSDNSADDTARHQGHSNVVLCILQCEMPTVFQPTSDNQ